MRQSDECWSQSHVNSISQIAPMHHNVVAQTSQINFHQQQQTNNQQPMQSQQYYCYPTNQQDIRGFSQYQPGQSYQQDPYVVNQSQQQQQQIPRQGGGNIIQPLGQQAYNLPSIMQNQGGGYGTLPAHILDQIRPYIGSPAPIFILPNNCPNPVAIPQAPAAPGPAMGCPGIGINCPSSLMHCPTNSCYPYHMAMSAFNPFAHLHSTGAKEIGKNCSCCSGRYHGISENHEISNSINNSAKENEEHRCLVGNDDTVCTRKNCPSSINLQALVSQLLAIQGTIPCAATRLVLRKIPGSNVTTTMEETIERAKRSLNGMTQEQLLTETRNAQQVNALINLHMTANPPPSVIPILTTVQLKVNLLKAHVDSLINRRVSESQGIDGAEGNKNLDPVLIAMKTDQELRDLLATLRQKECEERVNLNFAPYQSQRVIAECRLSNVQNKIAQIETEMDRRRNASLPRSAVAQQYSDPGCGSWYGYTGDISNSSSFGVGQGGARSTQNYDSPDPFRIQVRTPKRLNLQPHVGSPETTYERPKKTSTRRGSRSRKDTSDDDDCEETPKNSTRDPSNENHRCVCEKSSEEESADEGKKKLGGKILAAKELVNLSEDDEIRRAGLSIIKLSPNVVIVIDNPVAEITKKVDITKKEKDIVKTELKPIQSEDEKEKLADTEIPRESQKPVSVTMMEHIDSDKTALTEKSRKFKWGKKRDKVRDQKLELPTSESSRVNERLKEDQTEENYEAARLDENIVSEKIDYTDKSEGPSPIREQTIRMITKIDYEPSVAFRAFVDTDELPEKDQVIEERYKGSFTEDSLKSASTESTTDQTPESISLRVEDYETIASATKLTSETKDNLESSLDKEVQIDNAAIHRIALTMNQDEDYEERKIAKSTSYSSGMDQSNDSHHNDGNELATEEGEETEENLPSGDLSTIGNHVASFGSIIGKIATLKFQRFEESKESLFSESSTSDNQNTINVSVDENEGSSTTRGNTSKNDDDPKKEIGKWKFIKFSELEENSENSSTTEKSSDSETTTYVLPKIKHTVIEDKNRGEKYVVIEEPSEDRSKRLGEPYRTGRSLIIRSRLKSPQSSSSEQSGPFTLVKSPKHRDKNCLPLRIVSSKTGQKNRCKNTHELKSSDKFWIRTDSPNADDKIVDAKEKEKLVDRGSHVEKCKLAPNEPINETRNCIDSVVSVVHERVVEVHDYSKIRISSPPGTVENTDTQA